MFKHKVEMESNNDIYTRYERALLGRQRAYEFFRGLQDAFGKRLFGGFVKEALNQMDKLCYEDMGRKDFLELQGLYVFP